MKLNRLSAGLLAGLTSLAATAAMTAAGWPGHRRFTYWVAEMFTLGGGLFWLLDRLGVVQEPFRSPAVLERYAPRDPSRTP